uniref:Coiled-coil domain-containing protein 172 n=1 Tax=Pseudonaja textilis TaxID=8673 RepID=A0A670Y074_PSETE
LIMHTFIFAKIAEEDETFLKEIQNFNNEYGLILNREFVIKKRTQTEVSELDEKEKSMEHETIQLKIFHLQKNELKQDLSTLQTKLRGILLTWCSADLMLKKQLENYKEDEMENACEALQMEIEFLWGNIFYYLAHKILLYK